jgi:predicted alpha/beta-hydrolase family hydrolase
MKTKSISLKISSAIGAVTAQCFIPKKTKCIMTIAHGAGAGMTHPFMIELAKALSEEGIATMRFNFPFMENRKGRPDVPAVAHQTIEASILKAQKLFPKLPLFVSGKSFGGRMTSQYLSTNHDDKIKGVIFYGFPLHAPGKPSIERAEHLKTVATPMLFLQGTRDEFATLKLIESVCSSLPLADFVKIEGANHGFKAGKQDIMKILVTKTNEWIEKKLSG